MHERRTHGRWPHGLPTVVPGKMIVRFRADAVRGGAPTRGAAGARARAAASDVPEAVGGPLDYLARNAGLRDVRPVFSTREAALRRSAAAPAERFRLAAASSVRDASDEDLEGFAVLDMDARPSGAAVRMLRASPAFDLVEPMPARWTCGRPAADPRRNAQWGLRATEWFEADRPKASGVAVAILDTGVDDGHPDLAGRVASYDTGGASKEDVIGHGTHVAGIVGATTDNGVGITGFCDATLHVWKIFGDEPDPRWGEYFVEGEAYLRALRAVAASGAKVVNLSIGGGQRSETEAILFRRLVERGIVVVAAMGNEFEDGNPVEYPGAYEGVLAVGAVDPTGRRASFSNTGRHIGLCAPGVGIWSTLPRKASKARREKGYAAWDGTSMATPHVTAAAADLFARHPDWTVARVVARLRAKATRLAEMGSKRFTTAHGAGLLNLRASL